MPDNRTQVAITAEAMRKAEEALVIAMELNNPQLRVHRLETLRAYGDALLKHHNALEAAKQNSRRSS